MGDREAIQVVREIYADGRAICDRFWDIMPLNSLRDVIESLVVLAPSVLTKTVEEASRAPSQTDKLVCLIKGAIYVNRVVERAIRSLEEIPE